MSKVSPLFFKKIRNVNKLTVTLFNKYETHNFGPKRMKNTQSYTQTLRYTKKANILCRLNYIMIFLSRLPNVIHAPFLASQKGREVWNPVIKRCSVGVER